MQLLEGIRSIDELKIDNQRVLVRADLDVAPGASADELTQLKLEKLLPTLALAAEKEARVIIAAHRGMPNPRRPADSLSLESIGTKLSELSGFEVFLPDDCLGDAAKRVIADLRSGQICLLENLRFHRGEIDNDEAFARALAAWCDVYVNDALACCHESYASTNALPRLIPIRGTGLLLKRELSCLSRLTDAPEHPIVAVFGGAANSKRFDILELLLDRSDHVCVGGALAMTLLTAAGNNLGRTLVTEELLPRARSILERHYGRLHLPRDVTATDLSDVADGNAVSVTRVASGHSVMDIGPETISAFGKLIAQAKTLVYTGLMSAARHTKPEQGALSVLQCIASATGFSIVTGLESVVQVMRAKDRLDGHIDHISLGADASMAFIAGKRLPGIDALRGANNE